MRIGEDINTIINFGQPKLKKAKAESERIKSAILVRREYEKCNITELNYLVFHKTVEYILDI